MGCFGGWQHDTRKTRTFHFNQDVMKQGVNIFGDLMIYTHNCSTVTFSCCQCLTVFICSCLGDILSGISSPIVLFPVSWVYRPLFVSIFGASICVMIHRSISSKSSVVFHYIFISHGTMLVAESSISQTFFLRIYLYTLNGGFLKAFVYVDCINWYLPY